MAWHGGATGTGVWGLDRGLLVGGEGRPEGKSHEAKKAKGTNLQQGKARLPLYGRGRGGLEHPAVGPPSVEREL